MAKDIRQSLGEHGEDVACAELQRRGYAILARRYRTRMGEIDIVARDGSVTVFVEVKTRRHQRFGGPAAAVTRLKQRRMVAIAAEFLGRYGLANRPSRFDVVAVDVGQATPRIAVFTHAFEAHEARW